MNVAETRELLLYTAEKMVDSEPTLTELDLKIGDGDHGLGMQRGFAAVRDLLKTDAFQPKDIGELFLTAGTKMMSSMGGASGAIFGTLFRAGGKAIAGQNTFNATVLSQFLTAGSAGVFARGGAKPGDKTMMDALVAAEKQAEQEKNADLKDALARVAKAAEDGAESTRDQVAVFGRAKSLGERSLGYVDPGAVSMSLILKYMSEFVNK
ncbi:MULTISPECIES: dihydroxyacetone kinase subunit DhaL [Pasteurellaceae]|uniref:Dihydroxyacetone kinase, L subunit n=2 Tax=Pasteurellaceae TaxID=712 RepID=A6VPP2_ACTSZ|nr:MULTISPECIES: dihydroxyacetone kinase subunit DhaL [Pasteurellaceae]ABR74939.1 dihydroxyacetone kinase, L subunit [Actinobacillus succinogenes 130Z]PHI40650.1 dihydroxyacetone kinase subunit L [Actinobacillus succinogenes]QIM68407.1 dihydroxyacetone kinase subunit L [Basfia succiniciproducens]SCX74865.1 dihydroxyacetone kinase DhaL subunit [Basfia succiniciproducens]